MQFQRKNLKIKENSSDQNAINLSTKDLTPSQKSVLAKGPIFVPPPTCVNWLDLRKDFDEFVNQLRYEFKKQRTQQLTKAWKYLSRKLKKIYSTLKILQN